MYFDGENISFDASLVIYINSTNIPPIMIINWIYETQNLLSLWLVSFLVGLRTYQHPCKCWRPGLFNFKCPFLCLLILSVVSRIFFIPKSTLLRMDPSTCSLRFGNIPPTFIHLVSSSSMRWTSFNGWKFWPSQRPLSTSLDPGRRLSNF